MFILAIVFRNLQGEARRLFSLLQGPLPYNRHVSTNRALPAISKALNLATSTHHLIEQDFARTEKIAIDLFTGI